MFCRGCTKPNKISSCVSGCIICFMTLFIYNNPMLKLCVYEYSEHEVTVWYLILFMCSLHSPVWPRCHNLPNGCNYEIHPGSCRVFFLPRGPEFISALTLSRCLFFPLFSQHFLPAAEAGHRLPAVLFGHRRHRLSAVWLQHRSHQCSRAGQSEFERPQHGWKPGAQCQNLKSPNIKRGWLKKKRNIFSPIVSLSMPSETTIFLQRHLDGALWTANQPRSLHNCLECCRVHL